MRKLEKIDTEVHYASLDLDGDIPSIKFNRRSKLLNWIDDLRFENKEKGIVYLITNDGNCEIIVTDNLFTIYNYIDNAHIHNFTPISIQNSIIFLQEYQSFESAYSVALHMRENNPLCYDEPN